MTLDRGRHLGDTGRGASDAWGDIGVDAGAATGACGGASGGVLWRGRGRRSHSSTQLACGFVCVFSAGEIRRRGRSRRVRGRALVLTMGRVASPNTRPQTAPGGAIHRPSGHPPASSISPTSSEAAITIAESDSPRLGGRHASAPRNLPGSKLLRCPPGDAPARRRGSPCGSPTRTGRHTRGRLALRWVCWDRETRYRGRVRVANGTGPSQSRAGLSQCRWPGVGLSLNDWTSTPSARPRSESSWRRPQPARRPGSLTARRMPPCRESRLAQRGPRQPRWCAAVGPWREP